MAMSKASLFLAGFFEFPHNRGHHSANSHSGIPMPTRRDILSQLAAAACAGAFLGTVTRSGRAEDKVAGNRNLHQRHDFAFAHQRFTNKRVGRVAFLGGSITEMEGYRPLIARFLTETFPQTKFDFVNAGIASTCSTTGAFRLQTDVLAKGPVDLLIAEFAVNDDQDAHHPQREAMRGMEGLIRQALRANPNMGIVLTHFVNEGMLALLHGGNTPVSIAAHEKVAEHYRVSTVNLAQEAAERIQAGTLTWASYGGVHPGPIGNGLAAEMVNRLLKQAWTKTGDAPTQPLPAPLDDKCYDHGQFLPWEQATITAPWKLSPVDWKTIPGDWRGRFRDIPLLHCEVPGAELTFKFRGTTCGAYILAGPDAGTLETEVDNGGWRKVLLFHDYSGGLHYPRTVILHSDLADGDHQAVIRLAPEPNRNQKGPAARIVQLVQAGMK